jgi:hypothetical protein
MKNAKKPFEVMLSPQLRKNTRWANAVQNAVVNSMQKWFVTVDRRKLTRVLNGLIATAKTSLTDDAFRRSTRVRKARKMLEEIMESPKETP